MLGSTLKQATSGAYYLDPAGPRCNCDVLWEAMSEGQDLDAHRQCDHWASNLILQCCHTQNYGKLISPILTFSLEEQDKNKTQRSVCMCTYTSLYNYIANVSLSVGTTTTVKQDHLLSDKLIAILCFILRA